ncbi:isoaspartyl dipeptidase [Sinobacterium caligoides]|uniref:Isoaspartyl dipeptidase n=1 Tax=Sinobacterium caligoides TaxID=933926 RepID=A0A3N2E0C6_9GAMM|nr:beta-aspartyl-peptidase [Sinobacterium caligoides]ROS05561.1 isoaspartyl dipeptidase [Sinobacterium caligoides]
MSYLLKNARLYTPDDQGIVDILVIGNKIHAYAAKLAQQVSLPGLTAIDLEGRIVTPGLVDQHVHLIGGGGEGGFASRTPEIQVSNIVKHGVTTVLGLLGTDSDTRHPATLNAKARALTEEGISAWMLTGAYNIPSPTVTGSVRNDILYVERCIGLKLALSDHRAPHVSFDEFVRLASDCRIAGILSGKAGTLTLHMGGAPSRLDLLFKAQKDAAIPPQQFIPTHVNRTQDLYAEALRWAKLGGRIDLTAGYNTGDNCVHTITALEMAKEAGIDPRNITLSTDAQGSMPIFNDSGEMTGIGVAEQDNLLALLQQQVKAGFSISEALIPITVNVAEWLKLPAKGRLEVGYDADLIILNDDLSLDQTWAKGQCVFKDGQSLIKNMFE